MHGAAAVRKVGRQRQKIGNVENVKAWFHMRGAEAERQAEAARIFYSARGSDLCRRRETFAAEKGSG